MKRNITILFAMMLSMIASVANAENPKRSELTIVDKVEVNLTAIEAKHINASQRATVDLTDALAKFGSGGLGMALHKFYIAKHDEETEGKTDELTAEYNYREGWWLTDIYDETTGELTGECVADTVCGSLMYIRDIELDGKQLSLTVGQVAGEMLPGNTYSALLYYINGSNAIEIDIQLTITKAEMPKLADLTKVGEKTIDTSIFYNSIYNYRVINFNADSLYESIYATLPVPDCIGYEEGKLWGEDMKLVLYGESAENELTDNSTAFYGGYWVDTDGYVCGYNDEHPAFFLEPADATGLNVLHAGIYPNYSFVGTILKGSFYIIGANYYYKLNINLTVNPYPRFDECEIVDSLTYAVEIVPDMTAEHTTDVKLVQEDYMIHAITLNQYELEALLGEGTYEFCVENTLMSNDGEIIKNYNSAFSNAITRGKGYLMMNTFGLFQNEALLHIAASLSPFPMMTKAYGIGQESYFVVEDPETNEGYTEVGFNFWYQPGDAAVGDYYQNVFYLVNYETGRKLQLNINVVFVDQRNPVFDIVGGQTIELPQSNAEGTDYGTTTIDMSDILATLECSNINEVQWAAYNNLNQLLITPDYDDIYGYNFDAKGYLTAEDTKVFSVGFADGAFHSYLMNGSADTDYTTTIVATYNGKGYKFNVKVTKDPKNDTGIINITPTLTQGERATYNLNGQRVLDGQLTKGLYIINGKKVLVK